MGIAQAIDESKMLPLINSPIKLLKLFLAIFKLNWQFEFFISNHLLRPLA